MRDFFRQIQGARVEQEDAVGIVTGGVWRFLMLSDGMGGHREGRWAANTAVNKAKEVLEGVSEADWTDFREPRNSMLKAFGVAHQAILSPPANTKNDDRPAPAATFIMAAISGNKLWWVAVGDSFLLICRAGRVLKYVRTTNRSAVGFHINSLHEICASDEALSLQAGDVVILASDGLDTLNPISQGVYAAQRSYNYDYMAELTLDGVDAEAISAKIIQAVIEKNEPHQDNTSVVVSII